MKLLFSMPPTTQQIETAQYVIHQFENHPHVRQQLHEQIQAARTQCLENSYYEQASKLQDLGWLASRAAADAS